MKKCTSCGKVKPLSEYSSITSTMCEECYCNQG